MRKLELEFTGKHRGNGIVAPHNSAVYHGPKRNLIGKPKEGRVGCRNRRRRKRR